MAACDSDRRMLPQSPLSQLRPPAAAVYRPAQINSSPFDNRNIAGAAVRTLVGMARPPGVAGRPTGCTRVMPGWDVVSKGGLGELPFVQQDCCHNRWHDEAPQRVGEERQPRPDACDCRSDGCCHRGWCGGYALGDTCGDRERGSRGLGSGTRGFGCRVSQASAGSSGRGQAAAEDAVRAPLQSIHPAVPRRHCRQRDSGQGDLCRARVPPEERGFSHNDER